jgi:hypothetical protein
MPRKAIDYSKTIVYKIVSRNPELAGWSHSDYTTDFTKRKNYIKTSCKNGKDDTLFNFINQNGGFSEFEMLMISTFPTSNRELIKTHIFSLANPAIHI